VLLTLQLSVFAISEVNLNIQNTNLKSANTGLNTEETDERLADLQTSRGVMSCQRNDDIADLRAQLLEAMTRISELERNAFTDEEFAADNAVDNLSISPLPSPGQKSDTQQPRTPKGLSKIVHKQRTHCVSNDAVKDSIRTDRGLARHASTRTDRGLARHASTGDKG